MKMKFAMALALVLAILPLALQATQEKPLRIGIAQFADHPSLDNCRDGFLQGLKEAGFEDGKNISVNYRNAQADMGTAALIASSFVDNGYDLICAIATPMAMTAVNAADGKIPVVYSAVSAPVEAGLAKPDGLSSSNATGTSDQLPIRDQLALIRAFQPQAKTVGLLYTVGEINSQVQAEQYELLAAEYGFDVVSSTVTGGGDVALALPGLLARVDCLSMLTDNTVVQYLDVVLDHADAAGVPVYGSEIEQVKKGCLAAAGIDYLALGRQTGLIAARVLEGEAAGDIPFEVMQDSALFYNAVTMQTLHLELPSQLSGSIRDVNENPQ